MAEEDAKPKTTVDRLTIFVALTSSIASAVLAIFNTVFYLADRNDRLSQGVFDAQATIAKSYFESFSKLPKGEFCNHSDDALLFGRTALTLAHLTETQVNAEWSSTTANNAQNPSSREGVQAVAVLIYRDVLQRSKARCDGGAVIVKPGAPGKIIDATLGATGSASTYSIRNSSGAPTAASVPTVWIHYAAGSPDATSARAIQVSLLSNGFAVPTIDGVENVPSHNQVRVYRRQDAATAIRIAKLIGIPDAQIVNLESAYKNLPGNTFEIWLKRPNSEGGTLDFSKPENSALL